MSQFLDPDPCPVLARPLVEALCHLRTLHAGEGCIDEHPNDIGGPHQRMADISSCSQAASWR